MLPEQIQTRPNLITSALRMLARHGVPLDTSKGEADAYELACMIYGVDASSHPRLVADEIVYRHKQQAQSETNGRLVVVP